jgi:uncharacterized Fe-S cluster-containing radical SAM superfamily protein
LIGHDISYARDLSTFENLYVRVSMKGTNEDDFMRLTGAEPRGFELQIQALKNLARFNITTHPAVMVSFSSAANIKALRMRLKEIDEDFEDFEAEELALYGKVEERLLKAGLKYDTAYEPPRIPKEQV